MKNPSLAVCLLSFLVPLNFCLISEASSFYGVQQEKGKSKDLAKALEESAEAFRAEAYGDLPKILEPALESGDPEIETLKGLTFYFGWGIKGDHTQASIWFKKAAARNHAPAQYWLSCQYDYGYLEDETGKEALKWLELAVKQKYPPALHQLAIRHSMKTIGKEENPDYDPVKAKELLEMASVDQGKFSADPSAMRALAFMYLAENSGIPKDKEKGVEWLRKAAAAGNASAQYHIASSSNNAVERYQWMLLASLNKAGGEIRSVARNALKRLGKNLTEKQLEDAEREAGKIQKKIESRKPFDY